MKQVKTLTPEIILEFAQSLEPKIKSLIELNDTGYIFETKRGAQIYGIPFVTYQTFGFRSLLQKTGPNPKSLINGQASSNCKELHFFGESGPQLHFRDQKLTKDKNGHLVWGTSKDELNMITTKEDLDTLFSELENSSNQIEAIKLVCSRIAIKPPKNNFFIVSTIGSILTRPFIPQDVAIQILDKEIKNKELIMSIMRFQYKIKPATLNALKDIGISYKECLTFFNRAEYPQTIAHTLKELIKDPEEALELLKNVYANGSNHGPIKGDILKLCQKILRS
jgi:hypothetical protein